MIKKLLNFLRFETFDILFFIFFFITHSNKLVSQMLFYDASSSLLFAEIGLCFCMALFFNVIIDVVKFIFKKIIFSAEDKNKNEVN